MSIRLHLRAIALTGALIAASTTPVFGQESARAQSLPPVAAVPATPTKYDFQWEKYTVWAAQGGKAYYVFEGKQPIGIAVLGAGGKPEIFPVVSGVAAEELRASFKRYQRANGVGATPLSKPPTLASIATSPLPAAWGDLTPEVAFVNNGIHLSLSDGTRIDFLPASILVTMPAAMSSLPATVIGFNLKVRGGLIGQASGEVGITMNGQPLDWQRKGPVWDGLKALVLMQALGKAAQAALIAGTAPGRPTTAPDYIAIVAGIEKQLD